MSGSHPQNIRKLIQDIQVLVTVHPETYSRNVDESVLLHTASEGIGKMETTWTKARVKASNAKQR